MTKVDHSDPHPSLPARSNLARRFTEVPEMLAGPAASPADVSPEPAIVTSPRFDLAAQVEVFGADPSKSDRAKAALAEGEKRGRGRPKTVKPWEGICSKTEWYRRQKRP